MSKAIYVVEDGGREMGQRFKAFTYG